MKKVIAKIRSIPYEKRLLATSTFTTGCNTLIAAGKIIVGIFSDLVMCAVGVFNILLMITKITCIVGAKKNKPFGKRNAFSAVFLFFAGLVYALYMGASLVFTMPQKTYSMWTSVMMAAIAFAEMGVAIYGLIKTKRRGHYYRNIKIVSFVSALIAIMTAQVALLSFSEDAMLAANNSYTGIGIGIITMLLALYVYYAPQISVIDREHNIFRLADKSADKITDTEQAHAEITLVKSKIHGDYVFDYEKDGDAVDGHIKKKRGFWKGLPLAVKIIFIILSEILVFVWAVSYAVYFFRTLDLPAKQKKLMENNGYEFVRIVEKTNYSEITRELKVNEK